MMILVASSIEISRRFIFSSGKISKNPEVGFGVVGTKTRINGLASGEVSGVASPVIKAIA